MYNRRRSVLIAEHDRAMVHGLRLHLERAGFSVFVAYDGEQAAVLAARRRFELIIVNLELPETNGTEFCRHVREDLQLTDVPIAVCSAAGLASAADDLVFHYGIARVFCKPIDPADVVEFARETVDYLVVAV